MLDVEKIKSIPTLMETMTNQQIADDLGMKKWSVEYWIKQLRKRDYQLPVRRKKGRKSILD